jgi:hypothetical protein
MSRHISLRALAGALCFVALASCEHTGTEVLGDGAVKGDIFDRYVAIGNSLTAGYQAGGLTEALQRASYPVLLARSMGTEMALPIMAGRGCNPPIANFALQTGPGTITATARPTICDLRNPAFNTDILNNVGVPGAWSYDPISATSATSNTLTQLILGGKTQVERANIARPTFVSIWIGNNDLLGVAVSPGTTSGTTAAINATTDSATFAVTYNKILDSLTTHNAGLQGILIGVANVSALPLLFAGSNFSTASFKAQFDAIACGAAPPAGSAYPGCFGGSTVVINCAGSTNLVNTLLAFAIVRGQHPATISCTPGVPPGLGDFMILDASELTTISDRVRMFNNHISSRATALGWAYWDPNNTTDGLPSLRSDTTNSRIRITPSPTSTTNPFGTGMSFDGVHPSNTGYLLVANALIAKINAKYGTTLPNAQ